MHRLISLSILLTLIVAAIPAAADLSPMEQLGKNLFFDTNLSTPPKQSCATCHDPTTAFMGPISEINEHGAVYPGAVATKFGNRKPPTAAYASFSPDFYYDEVEGLYIGGMFWDGRALNTVEQAKGPFLNPVEMHNPNKQRVVSEVLKSDYADLYYDVFGWLPPAEGQLVVEGLIDEIYHNIAVAIAAYEASSEVNRFSSKYDGYLAGVVELTEQEAWGLELFEGKAMCSACHISEVGPDGEAPLFTDFTYDNLGVPKNLENPWYGMPPKINPDGADWIDYGLGAILSLPEEMGKFKVPTLRNVGMRPYEGFVQSYMHNGVFKSLREVVDFYNTRDVAPWPEPEVAMNVNEDELGNLGLTDEEVDAIVAFMFTLTDGYMDMLPKTQPMILAEPAFGLRGSTPNPFNPMTNVRFELPSPMRVVLGVYNVRGQRVSVLADRVYEAGLHAVPWNATGQASGTYYVRLEVPGRVDTHAITLVK